MEDKKLYLKFVNSGVGGVVTMYWEHAPKTCAAIWGALAEPIRWRALHAQMAGPEIMMGVPESHQNFDPLSIPAENQSVNPDPGELLWYYQPKNFFKIDPDEFWEIGFFYAPGGRTFGPTGWIPVNFFARMTEGLDAFSTECRKIRIDGAKWVELGRL